jgi:hypothetical protein
MPDNSFDTQSSFELHYWFNDESHTMDAIVQNHCEYELLGIMKLLASTFDADLLIETEPLTAGGLKKIFTFLKKSDRRTIKISMLTLFLSTVLVTPLSTLLTKLIEKEVEGHFEDKELKELQKDKIKADIENVKAETNHKILENKKLEKEIDEPDIDGVDKKKIKNNSTAILKKRSNFYELLEKYPKVAKINFAILDENKKKISESDPITRSQFKEFIMASDDLEPVEINDAEIEIISPVLKKGDYKWRGVYLGDTISFFMNSNEFKTLVQTGKVEFKNGSSIRCQLKINRKVGPDGIEQIVSYSIPRVDEYFENNKPIETLEGKKHKQKKEADKAQLKIGFNFDGPK